MPRGQKKGRKTRRSLGRSLVWSSVRSHHSPVNQIEAKCHLHFKDVENGPVEDAAQEEGKITGPIRRVA